MRAGSWKSILAICLVSTTARASDMIIEDYEADDYDFEVESLSGRELFAKKESIMHMHKQPAVPIMAVPIPQQQPMPVIQHLEVEEVRRVVSCPPGYDMINGNCVNHVISAPDSMCPPGYQMFNGECALFGRARRECQPGYQLSGGHCTSVEVVPVEFSCPDGVLDQTGRGCKVMEALGPQCPKGFQIEGGVCVQRFPASLNCPANFVYGHGGCVNQISFDAAPMCPAGSQLDESGMKCFTIEHHTPKCPKGYSLGSEGICQRKVKRQLASCPPGYVENHHAHVCERKEQSSPHLSCPPDSRIDPVTGQCMSELPAPVSCPEGFVQSRAQPGMCEQVVDEVGTCPPGTTPVGFGVSMRCQSSTDSPMIECCPPGYDQILNKCERREFFKAIPSCTDCVTVRRQPPMFSCPADYSLQGSACTRPRAAPCPMPAGAPDCAAFERLATSVSLRSLAAVDSASIMPEECLRIRKLCPKEDVIPAEPRCPGNSSFDGESCVERSEIVAEPKCLMGVLDVQSGQCIRVSSVPMKTECSPGSTRIGNRCVVYEEAAPSFSCPQGSIADRSTGCCVIRAPALQGQGEVFRTPPIPLCPSGTMSDFTCWTIDVVPRGSACPPGAVPANEHALHKHHADSDKYCVMQAELLVPPPMKKFKKAAFVCADGTMSHGHKCHSHEKANPTASCPAGTAVEGDGRTCVRRMQAVVAAGRVGSSAAVPICPVGTVVQGTKCVATRQVEAAVACPPGYLPTGSMVDGQECARMSERVAVCPVGSVQTADGCMREVTAQAVVSSVPLKGCATDDCYE